MKLDELKVGLTVLLELGEQEPVPVVVLKIGKIKVRVGNASSGSSWVYPQRLLRHVVPRFCDRGTTIRQNLPSALNIGTYCDHTLPEGTLEVWQGGKRIGRIENIGRR